MTTVPLPQALKLALQCQRAGRLAEAESICGLVLKEHPRNLEALHLAGLLAHQLGRADEAASLIERAIAANPAIPEFHNSLGAVRLSQGQFDAATHALRAALRIRPEYPEAHNNLGNALRLGGHAEESIAAFRHAIRLQPDFAQFLNNLGLALRALGQNDEAIATYRDAIARDPNLAGVHCNLGVALLQNADHNGAILALREALRCDPKLGEAYNSLGVALRATGKLDEALGAAQSAVRLDPNRAQWRYNLGKVLMELGHVDACIAEYRAAVALKPDFADAHNDLGCALRDRGRMDDAVDELREAIRLRPDYAPAHSNLANLLKDRGDLDDAVAEYRRAIRIDPKWITAHQNLLYALNFHPKFDAPAILCEHQAFNRTHAQPLAKSIHPHDNDRSPDRPLRVGFISPDFRDHVVGRNMLPLLAAHDRQRFQIACYGLLQRHDATTTQFQALADIWRDVAADSDERIAQIIRDDKIDILVDLTLHMEGNRLLVLARKPAPVQVTFGGYPGTTGLETIDYRLTDPHLDPPGTDEFYSEQSIRLPDCFWCYDPKQSDVPVNALPGLGGGGITFGCLNNFCKVNESVLAAWSAILRDCPGSRMIILAGAGKHRERTVAALGVEPDRVEFVEHCPREQYLKLHHRIDIVLDTFPYNGHTTSCDALWMGVPVVSLIGQTAVGRGGLSILSNINLAGLAATTPQHYIRIATELGTDLSRLSALRAGLRGGMLASPLTDAKRFAANIESTYRQMWRRWCQGKEI
jgi:predicted O-linked N-acetylglucosamine transferase (SPINDLY family)